MNNNRFTPLGSPGMVTTFYAYEGGPARNALLAAMAFQLAGESHQGPVLVIDWDLESPALHRHLAQEVTDAGDVRTDPPGLVEYFTALHDGLRTHRAPGGEADIVADAVLDAIDWQDYVERADGRHPVYLMRAGRFDEGYAERARRLDWHALFDACPALFRRFAARMARHFAHVLIAGRAGRSPAVSMCTTLVPDRIVGLFTPAPGSLEGFEGVVERAVEYRCTHEEEQRPLLVYPVACSFAGARSDPDQRWRRGDTGRPGYQPRIEALLRAAYGIPRLGLDSWFDEVQLALGDAVTVAGSASLKPFAACLLSWFTLGFFPWQSLPEVRLRALLARGRDADAGAGPALAAHLARLGALCHGEGRTGEAAALLQESLALRRAALGEDHPESRAVLSALAALHDACDRLQEARRDYELLAQGCARSVGAEHPDTLGARSRLACVLGRLGEGERALALHEQVVATCERRWGELHAATLDSLEDLALTLARQHEFDRARIVFERVFDARAGLQGSEHSDTLRCGQRLAQLLGNMGELGKARRLLESVLRGRQRHDGAAAIPTLEAREVLAEILAAQGDLADALKDVRPAESAGTERRDRRSQERRSPDRRRAGRRPGCTANAGHPASDGLQHELARLQDLIDQRNGREARALADRLRPSVFRSGVAHPLRRRGAAMIKQVYLQEGDTDALLGLLQDEVSSLEGALFGAESDILPRLR